MDADAIFEQTRAALAKMLKIKSDTIRRDSILKDDLGIDSVDGLDMCFALERKFGIDIEDEDMIRLKTVEDIVTLVQKKKKGRR